MKLRYAESIAVLVTVLAMGCAAANNNSGSTGTKATPVQPGLGATVKVGDLDLVVSAVRAVDTTKYNQFNSADTAVDVQATDSRGATYDFSPTLAMKLVDTNGVAHSPELGCADCPNSITSTSLVKGGHIEGSVYFKLAGATPRELDYQPLASTNKVVIPLSR